MVESVHADHVALQNSPQKWEAGSPNVEATLAWAVAIEYLESLDRSLLHSHIRALTAAAQDQLSHVPGVQLLGACDISGQNGILPISIEGWEAHAAARVLSQRFNICVRSGFHCAEPLHRSLGWEPTLRASFHAYTSLEDIDRFTSAVETLTKLKVG
jgi:cysteine desulfurase/selenocysteine lyase